jgi:hypothetical protein
LIFLSENVADAQPVRLNDNPNVPQPSQELSVLGWGALNISNPYRPVYADKLQIAQLNYITNDKCESTRVRGKSLYKGEIFPEMLCATYEGRDACKGDSGGPLISVGSREGLDVQVGIVSWGRGCAIYPGVYSRISFGYQWIRTQACWFSRNPPAYMACDDDERNPFHFYTEPTPSPIVSAVGRNDPNKQPQTTEQKQEEEGNTEADATIAATSPPKEPSQIDVTVEIQLDSRSGETSWFLADDDGIKIVNVPYETYNDMPNQLITHTVRVGEGTPLLFSLKDSAGDGICCKHGEHGWYNVSLTTEDRSVVGVIRGSGSFGRHSRHKFVAMMDPYPDETLQSQDAAALPGSEEQKIPDSEQETIPNKDTGQRPNALLTTGLEDYSKSDGIASSYSLFVAFIPVALGWLLKI